MNRKILALLEVVAARATLTKQDLAIRYRVTEKTIRRWTRSGHLPKPIRLHDGPRWSAMLIYQWEQRHGKRPITPQ